MILERWLELLASQNVTGGGHIKDAEVRTQCRTFLSAFVEALESGATRADASAFEKARNLLNDVSRSRALQGFTPSETATLSL